MDLEEQGTHFRVMVGTIGPDICDQPNPGFEEHIPYQPLWRTQQHLSVFSNAEGPMGGVPGRIDHMPASRGNRMLPAVPHGTLPLMNNIIGAGRNELSAAVLMMPDQSLGVPSIAHAPLRINYPGLLCRQTLKPDGAPCPYSSDVTSSIDIPEPSTPLTPALLEEVARTSLSPADVFYCPFGASGFFLMMSRLEGLHEFS